VIYSVNISAQADKDIRAIYEYIALTLMSPENANAQLSRLEDRINKLDNLPKRFPKYKNEIRFMPVDNYLVFYTVEDVSKNVSVLRVMYGKRNIEKTL
jgi:toxin ParE1/3/4